MITCFVGNVKRKQNDNLMVYLVSYQYNLIFVRCQCCTVSQHYRKKESTELLRTCGGDRGTVFTFCIVLKIKKEKINRIHTAEALSSTGGGFRNMINPKRVL